MRICFDMDGTLVDLYGVQNWLDFLLAENTFPYEKAGTLLNMQVLARLLNKLQREGYQIGIISWLCKGGSPDYNRRVTEAKKKWLSQHLHSVTFDFITIVEYGTNKNLVFEGAEDILFDDEEKNRLDWQGIAYDVNNILEVLKNI